MPAAKTLRMLASHGWVKSHQFFLTAWVTRDMKVYLTKEEAAMIIAAGLEADNSPLILKGDIENIDIKVSQSGVTLTIEYKDPRDEPDDD